MAYAKFDGIEWQTGFQPLMALNGSAVCDYLNRPFSAFR
jgi:hypothetical protein